MKKLLVLIGCLCFMGCSLSGDSLPGTQNPFDVKDLIIGPPTHYVYGKTVYPDYAFLLGGSRNEFDFFYVTDDTNDRYQPIWVIGHSNLETKIHFGHDVMTRWVLKKYVHKIRSVEEINTELDRLQTKTEDQ